eukprot:TRINITY_DN7167_c0_g2_i2.p1 TRINITY_DN7167_c0_g2~~TRINITY_DN7167_c0_g2_i2.p1  ORF type:complete len:245 (-),score=7.91 TRINITY_DN7167_c0_g2_i2:36-770(-)
MFSTLKDQIDFGVLATEGEWHQWGCRSSIVLCVLPRSISVLTEVHMTFGFLCIGYRLDNFLPLMDSSIRAMIPLGIISCAIEVWISGVFLYTFPAGDTCTVHNDILGLIPTFICVLVVVVNFLLLALRAHMRKEDTTIALCVRVFAYLFRFLLAYLPMMIFRASDWTRPTLFLFATTLEHLNGFMLVLTYSLQSKLCQQQFIEPVTPTGQFATPVESSLAVNYSDLFSSTPPLCPVMSSSTLQS